MKSILRFSCLFLLILTIQYQLIGQSVGIAAGSVTMSPTFSVLNTGTINVSGSFKNTGTISLTGTVTVNMAVNTSTNTTPNYVFRNASTYTVSAFAANATKFFSIQDVASGSNQYRVDGNGTTVVVWPVFNSNNSTISDSGFTSILVVMPNFIDEYDEFEAEVLKISNPIFQNVELVYNSTVYKEVLLVDVFGKVVQIINNCYLKTELLNKGLYYLNFHNSIDNRIITKKIMIQ